MADVNKKELVGRAEVVSFPELGILNTHARVDTGAKTSALSAQKVALHGDVLKVQFFDDAKIHEFGTFGTTVVSSSTGHIERRYKVQVRVLFGGKKIRAWFTLADRSTRIYPVLIGRNVLRGKFIVDVKEGTVLSLKDRGRATTWRARLTRPKKAARIDP